MPRSNLFNETLKVLKQTGTRVSLLRDRSRISQLPGKRVSKFGNVYWETRKNRSDNPSETI